MKTEFDQLIEDQRDVRDKIKFIMNDFHIDDYEERIQLLTQYCLQLSTKANMCRIILESEKPDFVSPYIEKLCWKNKEIIASMKLMAELKKRMSDEGSKVKTLIFGFYRSEKQTRRKSHYRILTKLFSSEYFVLERLMNGDRT